LAALEKMTVTRTNRGPFVHDYERPTGLASTKGLSPVAYMAARGTISNKTLIVNCGDAPDRCSKDIDWGRNVSTSALTPGSV
jgi:hypothetical protein